MPHAIICLMPLYASSHYMPQDIICLKPLYASSHYMPQVIICLKPLYASSHYMPQVIICLKPLYASSHYMPQKEKSSYDETCLNRTLNKSESFMNRTIKKVPIHKIFVNWTYINRTPDYSECKSWSHVGSV
jgi:hypothetical protein